MGGLAAWTVTALVLGISGPPAIAIGLTAAILLDITGKTFYNKYIMNGKNQVKEQGSSDE